MVSNTNDNNKSKEQMTHYHTNSERMSDQVAALVNTRMLEWIEETTGEVYAIWDNTGVLVYISKSIERLFGYELSMFTHASWSFFLSESDINYLKQKFDNENSQEQFFNVSVRHKNGRYIWCECFIKKIVDTSYDKTYYFSTFKDVSDKKEVEEMMVRSEKMSIAGQLAAGVAHEIRNPLTSIKGFLQLLQAGINRKDEYYKIMIDEIEKMEAITSEMLFISKPLTNYLQEESVTDMVSDVVTLLASQAKIKDIEIVHENTTPSFIYCDKSQIKQVLINLIKNAIEAMDHPGTITITNETKESFVEINIIDEGEGIPQEVIHKLGEPFFTTKQHGTGLGLMITKQILTKHHATMDILQNKEKGSTFSLKFLNKSFDQSH